MEEELQKENATLRKKVDVLQSELNNMKHAWYVLSLFYVMLIIIDHIGIHET